MTFLPPTPAATRRWWDEFDLDLSDRLVKMTVVSDGEAIVATYFGRLRAGPEADEWINDRQPVAEAIEQLEAYAASELVRFALPLRPTGSTFQTDVWTALRQIPYGTTTTYGRIAAEVGRPTGSRAVGSAVGTNPIPIIVPCHRVIGANGSLTGFSGGMDNKVSLLRLEGITAL